MSERSAQLAEIINELSQTQTRLEAAIPTKLRPYWDRLPVLPRACLILGARGCGKSTFVLNTIRGKNYLFVSADSPSIALYSLWDIAKAAFLQGFEGIVFDEVHCAKDWSKHLKAIYDAYPKHGVWATDSSSAVLRHSVADLSRRFIRIRLPLLSFREYIYLSSGKLFPVLETFAPDLQKVKEIVDQCNIHKLFKEYLAFGTKPIFQEGFYEERSLNILEKIIFSDLPFFVSHTQENHYRALKGILSYLAHSNIPRLNLERLCKEWQIGKEKLYELISVAEEIHLLRVIRHSDKKPNQSKGAKVFLHDPTWYSVLKGDLGNQREAYVVCALQEMNHSIQVPKDDSLCDFIVSDTIHLEVGGKNKSLKKADWVIRDDLTYPDRNALPLWLLGMSY